MHASKLNYHPEEQPFVSNGPHFAAAARHALSDKQLISLLSNQLEILMADGEFFSTERRMMSELVRLLQFPPEDYARIEKVILLKNQRNGLFAS